MKLRYLYLVFCLLGLVLPYSQFIPWITEHHGLSVPLFLYLRQLQLDRTASQF
jgi:hypothetical protein